MQWKGGWKKPAVAPALLWLAGLSFCPAARASCQNPANAIEAENCLPGSPRSEWDLDGGDGSIAVFPTEISVQVGDTISFKVQTDAQSYTFDLYRMGYYGGNGARHVASLSPAAPQAQPPCLMDNTTNLIDCGNWAVSASWTVPPGSVSGIYRAALRRTDTGMTTNTFFVVRDDSSHSDLLFQTSDTTWHAYNFWGGESLYAGSPPINRAYMVSYNRPYNATPNVAVYEQPMVEWLERNAYDVSYFTDVDSDRRGQLIGNHKVFLSVGHDEYWSGAQRANVEAARDAGVNLAFFSGNEVYWKTRWAPSIDGSGQPYRTLVCYKESTGSRDPQDPPTWTGFWRDLRAPAGADGGRPENALTGSLYGADASRDDTLFVSAAEGRMRFWRNTAMAALQPGQSAAVAHMLGYEWNEDPDDAYRPPGMIRLSSTTVSANHQVGYVDGIAGVAVHHTLLFKRPNGALVFNAGSMQWSWGLDNSHDGIYVTTPNQNIQQATVNVFADMGVQPAALQAGLLPAAKSSDLQAPASQIVFPPAGAQVSSGTPVTVSGTAADAGGGVVGGVEVTTDGGLSWHTADGLENWSYTWTPGASDSGHLMSRAVDDSGNLEAPSRGVAVSIGGSASANTQSTTPPPPPALSGLSPAAATAGGGGFTLTAAGSNFAAGAVLQWNGAAQPTTVLNGGSSSAAIPAALVASSGTAAVTVANPGPGGGISAALSFQVLTAANPSAALAALSPASATAAGPSFTLTLTGSNFIGGSTVQWNGLSQPTSFISGTSLTVLIPAALLTASGTASVAVFNPPPGGGLSPARVFNIGLAPPVAAAIAPSSATAGGAAFSLAVTGANYVGGSVVQWNGAARPTTFISGTQLQAAISAADVAAAAAASVVVFTPGIGGGASPPMAFQILPAPNPVPAVTAAMAGPAQDGSFMIQVGGSNFVQGAVVQYNGIGLPSVFLSSHALAAPFPPGQAPGREAATLAVFNPPPGGGSSEPFAFTAAVPAGSLDAVRVYPNPWRANAAPRAAITFDVLPMNTSIEIFTVSGRLVKKILSSSASAEWDLTDEIGQPVASGFYLYLVADDQERKARGKLAVIR